MTHLDQLGKQAALFPDYKGADDTHGIEEIYQIAKGYDTGSPEKSSRKLKENWVKYDMNNRKNKKPELQRTENAESYAAAATEFWFQSKCGRSKIKE